MQDLQFDMPELELGMQELEPMEAPGLWTAIGASVGATVVSLSAYGSYAASVAITT
jgi:hypothetical protein